MSKRTIFSIVGLSLVALIAVPLVAVASGVGPKGFGHCHRGGEPTTEAELRDRMDRGATFVLNRTSDVTDEQRAEIDAILDAVAPEAWALKSEGKDLREAVREAVTGETIDADALEAFRAEGLEHADEASKLLVETFVEIAEVLTPEQRAELAEQAQKFHERWN